MISTESQGRDTGAISGSAAFNARARASTWSELQARTVDLLVIGGGITGVGIAHEAAGRGLEVALLEAGDFGQGTSSRSSRLIHGGLRYLETYDFGLVFEALAERGRLLRHAPHLVQPLAFLYPVYAGARVGMLKLRAGMLLYDALAWVRRIHSHRMLSARAARQIEPGLGADGLRGAALYYDAQVDDARLTLSVARAAWEAGARLIPHARVTDVVRGPDGRVTGVRAVDARTGAAAEFSARLVVCAAGPWTDEVRRLLHPQAPPLLRPTKGIHLQLPRERVGNAGAITFLSPIDNRVMFVLPWGPFTYVGTTDTEFEGSPAEADASAEDVDYVLRSVNAIFPAAALQREDVLSTWTGVRPLLAPPSTKERRTAGQTSREHEIWREEAGPLFVAGGKLTTFRVMGREVAEEAASILKREHGVESGDFDSRQIPLPGAPEEPWDHFQRSFTAAAAALGVDAECAHHLATAYGADAAAVLERVRQDPGLGGRIVPSLPYLWAEVPHVVGTEMALTLEDVLRRRLHIFYDSADGGMAVARRVAELMGADPTLAWSDAEVEAEVDHYHRQVLRTRPPRREDR